MSEPQYASPFTDVASVEAWDAWFRWRDGGVLHDTAIEDTWLRVVDALVSIEPSARRARQRERLLEALSSWRLLPDERVLATAGTGAPEWHSGPLHAALNAAAFVACAGDGGVTIQSAALADCAALALRALDDAALAACIAQPRVCIGMVGIADALALLDTAYDSDAGRAHAVGFARAAAEGCLAANAALAEERGARHAAAHVRLAPALRDEAHWPLLHDAARHGVRFRGATALTSQPRLALLANDVADAADPLRGENHVHVIAAPAGPRTIHSSGHALNLLRARGPRAGRQPDTLASLPVSAQLRMRAALQPWFDLPIAYPLLVLHDPDPRQRRDMAREASHHGLPPVGWRASAGAGAGRPPQ